MPSRSLELLHINFWKCKTDMSKRLNTLQSWFQNIPYNIFNQLLNICRTSFYYSTYLVWKTTTKKVNKSRVFTHNNKMDTFSLEFHMYNITESMCYWKLQLSKQKMRLRNKPVSTVLKSRLVGLIWPDLDVFNLDIYM